MLIIDCDAQANLSSLYLTGQRLQEMALSCRNVIGMIEPNRLRAERDKFDSYEFAGGQVDDNAIQQVQTILHIDKRTGKQFSIIPNTINATKYGKTGADQRGLIFQNFQNAIQKLSYDYDIILLDCNPSATLLSECALHSATDVLIPLRNDKFTTEGLEKIDDLLGGLYGLDYTYGQVRGRKQLWTMINFADLATLKSPNEQLSLGKGLEADLLKKFYFPLLGKQDLSRFRSSLLETRVPRSGFLTSKPVATAPLDPDCPPSRNLLNFFGNSRAKAVEDAISSLALELYEKSKSNSVVMAI